MYKFGDDIQSVALDPDGTLWVGIQAEGAGRGLQQLKDQLLPLNVEVTNGFTAPALFGLAKSLLS
jgi:hypothetical protein